MRSVLIVLSVFAVALSFRLDGQAGPAPLNVSSWARAYGYEDVQRVPITSGGSYVATRMMRTSDGCELSAIPIEFAAEFWSVVPSILGPKAWRAGRLWDWTIQALPEDAKTFWIVRTARRLSGHRIAAVPAVVFGPEACLAEWATGVAD